MLDKKYIRANCRLAIENILKEGITDVEVFNSPFEIEFLKIEDVQKQIVDFVSDAIMSNNFNSLKIHKLSHVLVPKKNLCDFRICSWVEVVNEITYLTLVLCIANKIEISRINKTKKIVFSYRYNRKDGYIFDFDYHFTSFRKEIERKTKINSNKVVVECDISNFYDRVNIHRIESALLSIPNIDNDIVKLINETLLFWANRDSYSIPVGSNASRILAESALINVDSILISHKVDFCRFVDDYRIFAKDASTAHSHLSLLVQALNREGLFINTYKTKIKDISKVINQVDNELSEDNIITSNMDSNKIIEDITSRINDDTPKIIRGYNGLIPTKFRKLSDKEILSLKTISVNDSLLIIKNDMLLQPEEFTKSIRVIVANNAYNYFTTIAENLRKYPQLIPYFVDCITKYYNFIEKETIHNIKNIFKEWYNEIDVPEYILIYITRLFTLEKNSIDDKDVLLNAFRNLKRVGGNYIGRALLEALNDRLTRAEVLEVREYYIRADIWEKRQILRLVQNSLPDGEKRAFFKDIEIHNVDILTQCALSLKKDYMNVISYK